MGRVIRKEDAERRGLRITGIGGEARGAGADARRVPPEVLPDAAEPEDVARIRRLVQAMLSGFARQRRELLSDLQPYVVRIAVEIARRIVHRELSTDPGMVTRIAQSALEQIGAAGNVRVRAHPLDVQVLQRSIMEIVSAPDEAAAIEFVPDGSIERGGCVVDSDKGIVDARLHTQFEEMQTSLLEALETRDREDGS